MSDTLRDPHDQKLAVEFHAIVAGWDDYDRCWRINKDGTRCVRQATWLVSQHGHEPARRCGQHLRMWRRLMDAHVAKNDGKAHCSACGERLISWAEVCSAVRI